MYGYMGTQLATTIDNDDNDDDDNNNLDGPALPVCLFVFSFTGVRESPYMYRVSSGDIRACRYLLRYRGVFFLPRATGN